jgi:hypothetical protein
MTNLARLAIFFSNFFILSLLVITGIRFLFVWTDAVCAIPALNVETVPALAAAAKASISTAIYCSVLFSLSYSARRTMSSAFSIFFVLLFTFAYSSVFSLALDRLETMESSARITHKTLGGAGLRLDSGGVTTVLIGDPSDAVSPRVVAMPARSLILQGIPPDSVPPGKTFPVLPPVPFYRGDSRIMGIISLDFDLASEQLFIRLQSGIPSFCTYLFSLALLLSAFRFVFEFSAWPLTNLFLGILIFRSILSFEVFLNSKETQNLIHSFTGHLIPPDITSPLIYTGIALLILIYSLLASGARGRRRRTRSWR